MVQQQRPHRETCAAPPESYRRSRSQAEALDDVLLYLESGRANAGPGLAADGYDNAMANARGLAAQAQGYEAMKAEHAKEIMRARNAGLEEAAARCDSAAAEQRRGSRTATGSAHALFLGRAQALVNAAHDIRARKEPES